MKRPAALTLLLACLVLVPLSHLELRAADDSWLLVVDGRPVDVRGQAAEHWNRWRRDCGRILPLAAGDAVHAEVLQAVRQYSPPDSHSAQLQQLLRSGDWAVAEVRFGLLQNAVVLLQQGPGGWRVQPQGIWSGTTHPYRYAPFVRRYLQAQVPKAPAGLIQCLDPSNDTPAPGA